MKGDAVITKTMNRSGNKEHQEGTVTSETIEIEGEKHRTVPKDEVARIDYEAGVTLNMGDFESARVNVRVSIPCRVKVETIDRVYDFAKSWVQSRLEAEVESLKITEGDG